MTGSLLKEKGEGGEKGEQKEEGTVFQKSPAFKKQDFIGAIGQHEFRQRYSKLCKHQTHLLPNTFIHQKKTVYTVAFEMESF